MSNLVKIIGISIAVAGLATWIGASSAVAKPAYKTATGYACDKCHDPAKKPNNKNNLLDFGKKFQKCMVSKSDAAQCKNP